MASFECPRRLIANV